MIQKFILGAACAIAISLSGTAFAGPVFLTGHDPDFHAQPCCGAGGNLLTAGINFATSGSTATFGGKFLWVESTIPVPGGHLRGSDGLLAVGLAAGTDFDIVDAAGFTALSNAALSGYTAIGVASSFGGTLTRAELDALIARSADIATFINNGGGLFASAECYPCGANLMAGATAPDLFGYLPVDVTSIGASPPFTVTPYGASLGLVDADMNDPTHNSFGLVGGLNVVDTDAAGNATTLAGVVRVGGGGFETIPEPTTLAIFGLGLAGLRLARRRRMI